MGMLTKESIQAARKKPKVVELASLGGAKVILRPMTAGRRLAIEKRIPEDKGADYANTLGLEVVADTVVCGKLDDNGEIVAVGNPVWTVAEANDLEADLTDELIAVVGKYLMPEDDPAKNSTPASDSRSA